MVRHVFVQIREDQQQFEHPVALLGIRILRAFFEIFHNCERISQKPLKAFRINRDASAAAIERLIRALERFVHEMVETKLLAGERLRNRLGTLGPLASYRSFGIHHTPRTLGAVGRSEAGARLTQ